MDFLGINLDKLWWGICKGLLWIIDGLDKAFNFLIGADTVSASANQGQGGNVNNLFVSIFNGGENGEGTNMTQLYLYIMLGCIAFLCIFIAIGAIKAQFTKGVTDSLQQIGMKSFFAVIKMVAIPIVFLVALQAMGVIINFLIGVMSTGTDSPRMAEALLNACWSGSELPSVNDGFSIGMDYEALKTCLTDAPGSEFNYLLCILSSAFLVVTLVTVSISLVKRIIEVFFYYLTAPIALCRTPLDDGKSFELWKENTVSKLLGAGGIIISMYLFYTIIPVFNQAVESWKEFDVANRSVVATILQILFIIGGSTVPASASMLMAQLISQGAGQNESNNMMHTQQMLGNAMRATAATGGRMLLGAMSKGGVGGAAGSVAKAVTGMGSGATQNAVTAGMGSAVGTAARAGAAAMSAFNGGGASGLGSGTSSPSGAAAAISKGGASSKVAGAPTQTKGFKQYAKENVAKSWKGGKEKIANASPYLGIAGKAGAALGVGIKGAAGTVGGVAAAGIKAGKDRAMAGKPGRWLDERRAGQAVKKSVKAEQNAADKAKSAHDKAVKRANDNKKLDFNTGMGLDRENNSTKNTSAFMTRKIDNWENRAKALEEKINKDKKMSKWSDEKKQEYRRSQLENEANRIGAFADQAHGNMDETSINRFKTFYDNMSKSLYGEGKEKDGGTKE